MNTRTRHKHIAQRYKPFHDAIARYNGKIRKCNRWRNRRKAQKLYNNSIWKNYERI